MTSRWVVPFLITTIVLVGLGAAGASPPCTDPAGCIWLRPGEPLTIGVARITNGTGIGAALEVQQGAMLAAALDGHSIAVQPFFSACLPELNPQSTIDLAAASRVLAVLGPTCAEDAADFGLRMSSASQAVISPLPFVTGSGDTTLAFRPDPRLMAQQVAGWMPLSEISSLAVTADSDPASQSFREAFCATMASRHVTCDTPAQESSSDAVANGTSLPVWISLQSDPTFPTEFLGLASGQPALAISLSQPPMGSDSHVIFTQWIGPTAWQDQGFLTAYTRQFQTPPVEFAGLLAYTAVTPIHQAALETAERLWNGSWLIPRQAYQIRLTQLVAQSTLFQYSCPAGSLDCRPLPMALFQWSGNEYRFVNS